MTSVSLQAEEAKESGGGGKLRLHSVFQTCECLPITQRENDLLFDCFGQLKFTEIDKKLRVSELKKKFKEVDAFSTSDISFFYKSIGDDAPSAQFTGGYIILWIKV